MPKFVVFITFPDESDYEPFSFNTMNQVRQFTNLIEGFDDVEYHVFSLEEVYSWKPLLK